MRAAGRAALVLAVFVTASPVAAATYEDSSGAKKALYTAGAVLANVVPGVSSVYAKRCLPGYILCKASFAIVSLFAATEQLVMAGNGSMDQTRAILHRGFSGDWIITPRHIAGDATPEPWPDPPAASASPGGWTPPPR